VLRKSSKKSKKKSVNRKLHDLGFFALCALVVLGAWLIKNAGIGKEVVASDQIMLTDIKSTENAPLKEPTRIIIPDLSIDIPTQRSEIVKGYWEVFEDKAGWGEGSGYPGETGNQVIFAHAREGLFIKLPDIKPGAKIYVTTENGWYSYEVKEIKEVIPSDISVLAPTDDETLTLYTCSGYKDQKRLVVVAKRI
jgi:LPXTG-site transpeptidase (sortase) family protein